MHLPQVQPQSYLHCVGTKDQAWESNGENTVEETSPSLPCGTMATSSVWVKAVVKALLKSPSIESWESLEAPADVCTPEVTAFALARSRLCSEEPFQGVLFTGQAG